MTTLDILNLLQSLSTYYQHSVVLTLFIVPLCLIVLDVLSGILSACKRGVFAWSQLSAFLGNDFLKYLGAFLGVCISYFVFQSELFSTCAALLTNGTLAFSIIGSIVENLSELAPNKVIAQEIQQAAKVVEEVIAAKPEVVVKTNTPKPTFGVTPVEKMPTQVVPAVTLTPSTTQNSYVNPYPNLNASMTATTTPTYTTSTTSMPIDFSQMNSPLILNPNTTATQYTPNPVQVAPPQTQTQAPIAPVFPTGL